MRGVRLHRRPGGGEPTLQLAGEQQVGQFRLAVGRPREVRPRLPVEILQADVADEVHPRRHRDHAVGDLRQQQVGQREVAEVVGADLAFEPVDGLRVRHRHDAGVVDQHVDSVDTVGETPDRRQVLQVELAHLEVAGHARRRRGALVGVADGQDHLGSDPCEFTCGDLAEAAVGARDDHGASGERGQSRRLSIQSWQHSSSRGRSNYFLATLNPAMTASMSGASAAALSA